MPSFQTPLSSQLISLLTAHVMKLVATCFGRWRLSPPTASVYRKLTTLLLATTVLAVFLTISTNRFRSPSTVYTADGDEGVPFGGVNWPNASSGGVEAETPMSSRRFSKNCSIIDATTGQYRLVGLDDVFSDGRFSSGTQS